MKLAAHVALAFGALIIIGGAWPIIAGDTLARPDIVAVAALFFGLSARDQLAPAIAASAAVGYLADVLAGTPTGLLTTAACLICVGSQVVQDRLMVRGGRALLIACGAASVGMSIAVVLLSRIGGVGGAAVPFDLSVIGISALLSAVIGAPLFALHRRLDARLTRRHA